MRLVNMSHAFGGSTTLPTIHKLRLVRKETGNDRHDGNPTSSHGKQRCGKLGLSRLQSPRLAAYLLMHMGEREEDCSDTDGARVS